MPAELQRDACFGCCFGDDMVLYTALVFTRACILSVAQWRYCGLCGALPAACECERRNPQTLKVFKPGTDQGGFNKNGKKSEQHYVIKGPQ